MSYRYRYIVSGSVAATQICGRFACPTCKERGILQVGADEKVYGCRGLTLHLTCSECDANVCALALRERSMCIVHCARLLSG